MIAITGSESFIGARLCAALDARGQEWTGLDTAPRQRRTRRGDIRGPAVAEWLPEDGTLIHLAAVSRDGDCRRNPREAFDVNVGGTLNLIDAARRRGVRRFVFASSEWVYGEVANDEVQREDAPLDAQRLVSEYALSKLAGERLLAGAARQGGFEAVTVLRFGIVYGPRKANWSAVEMLHDAVAHEDHVEVKGSLATARRFIHVEDICAGILAAAGRAAPGFRVFNLSGDWLVTLGEVIETSMRLTGRKPPVREGAPRAVSIRNPDNARARAELGWAPAYGLAEGLATLARRVAA
ncbi:MAG: NAD(P)-dependent oxidoreductase [Bryobacterales bacterium]|nr:NAD(P)-dependent oxidoreductase [Bryobacterales bacterium]